MGGEKVIFGFVRQEGPPLAKSPFLFILYKETTQSTKPQGHNL
jgi:hypothetical protein